MSGKSTDELILLEEGGCLTAEALVFAEELDADQRNVVERHLRACTVCAQQRMHLVKAAHAFSQQRPEIEDSAGARAASQQAALRGLLVQRKKLALSRFRTAEPKPLPPWYRSGHFWFVIASGVAGVLLAVILAISLR